MTNERKWTPGPWSFDGPHHSIIVWGPEPEQRVCFMTSDGPAKANAHLIASAPEMYAALEQHEAFLERLIAMVTGGADISDVNFATSINALLDMSADALSKARGESQ